MTIVGVIEKNMIAVKGDDDLALVDVPLSTREDFLVIDHCAHLLDLKKQPPGPGRSGPDMVCTFFGNEPFLLGAHVNSITIIKCKSLSGVELILLSRLPPSSAHRV